MSKPQTHYNIILIEAVSSFFVSLTRYLSSQYTLILHDWYVATLKPKQMVRDYLSDRSTEQQNLCAFSQVNEAKQQLVRIRDKSVSAMVFNPGNCWLQLQWQLYEMVPETVNIVHASGSPNTCICRSSQLPCSTQSYYVKNKFPWSWWWTFFDSTACNFCTLINHMLVSIIMLVENMIKYRKHSCVCIMCAYVLLHEWIIWMSYVKMYTHEYTSRPRCECLWMQWQQCTCITWYV